MRKFMKTAISLALALALLLTSVDTGLFAATVDTAAPGEGGELAKAVLDIDRDLLQYTMPKQAWRYIVGNIYTLDTEAADVKITIPYDGNLREQAAANLRYLISGERNAVYRPVLVERNGQDLWNRLKDALVYTWKSADGSITYNNSTEVKDVGDYRLEISLPAQEGICSAADPVSIFFTIEKAKLIVGTVDDTDNYNYNTWKEYAFAGKTVEEAKAFAKKNYDIYSAADSGEPKESLKDGIVDFVEVEILDPHTGAETTDTVLAANKDYILSFAVNLTPDAAKCYEVAEDGNTVVLRLSAVPVRIGLTYAPGTNNGASVGKTYDGDPFTAADAKAAFTAKVFYDKDFDPSADPVDIDIDAMTTELPLGPGMEISGYWLDANGSYLGLDAEGNPVEPVNAGRYLYVLNFTDESGTYSYEKYVDNVDASDLAYVVVTIAPAQITVRPDKEAITEGVYAGMYPEDILKMVKGVAYKSDGTVFDDFSFGYKYLETAKGRTADATEEYKPVYKLQVATGSAVVTWIDVKSTETVEAGKQYRIMFTGEKAVYMDLGLKYTALDINSGQTDYHVDIPESQKYTVPVTVKESTEVVIDASKIDLKGKIDGTGSNFGDPFRIYYKDDTDLYRNHHGYTNKSDYKKAEISSGDKKNLSYRWQVFVGDVEDYTDKDGKVFEPTEPKEPASGASWDDWTSYYEARALYEKWISEDDWEYVGDGDYDGMPDGIFPETGIVNSPYKPGVYRLQITYYDPTHETCQKAPANVYYVIRPQEVVAEFTGVPSLYADGTQVGSFLMSLRDTEGFDVKFYEAAVTDDPDDKKHAKEAAKGEELSGQKDFKDYIEVIKKDPAYYLQVESRRISPDGSEVFSDWTVCRLNESFIWSDAAKVEYRLNVRDGIAAGKVGSGYNFGAKLGTHNQELDGVDTGYWAQLGSLLDAKKPGDTRLVLSIDSALLSNTRKVYDGKGIDTAEVAELLKQSLKTADGTAVDPASLTVKYLMSGDVFPDFDPSIDCGGVPASEAVHAASWTMDVVVESNETYTGTHQVLDAKFVIEKKPVKVTPVFLDPIRAGDPAIGEKVVSDYKAEIDSPVEGESVGAVVLSAPPSDWMIYRADGTKMDEDYEFLSSSETYYAEPTLSFGTRTEPESRQAFFGKTLSYSADYKAEPLGNKFKPSKVCANVTMAGTLESARIHDAEDDKELTHVIRPLEGLPYWTAAEIGHEAYGSDPGSGWAKTYPALDEADPGNYLSIRLYAPDELVGWGTSLEKSGYYFRSSIEKAGGIIYYEPDDDYIDVAFRYDDDEENTSEDKNHFRFTILWAKDYEEKYEVDLSGAELFANLEDAVAPKSLTLVAPNKKMAVGETQQLDVKIQRNQPFDIVYLVYESDDTSILQVSEDGNVTALSKGDGKSATATITVYAARETEGKPEIIRDSNGKPVKSASVKITVSDVTAPKLSKVEAKDTWASLTYTKPSDGYRREYYVLEGKKSQADFENAIAEVRNGNFDAFVYTRFASETTDPKGVVTNARVSKLTPNTEYTVYVRNISGQRTLSNGKSVALSVAGTVKAFKTMKSQVKALELTFGETAKKAESDDRLYVERNFDHYHANMEDKTVVSLVSGKFYEIYDEKKADYADDYDHVWFNVPLDKTLKNTYTEPSLSWMVTNGKWVTEADYKKLSKKNQKNYTFYDVNGRYYENSPIASIDKKGKITMKGKGYVYICVWDKTAKDSEGNIVAWDRETLLIDAEVKDFSAKPVTLYPGQKVNLASFLTYKGKSTVINYEKGWQDLTVTAEGDTSYFKLTTDMGVAYGTDPDHTAGSGRDYWIEPLAGGKTMTLKVSDGAVPDKVIQVRVSSKAVEPVKDLKAASVLDNAMTYTFTYPVNMVPIVVGLYTPSGQLVGKNYFDACTNYIDPDTKKAVMTEKGEYVYKGCFSNLNRLTQYSLKAVAVWNGENSNVATMKFKTINIPAYRVPAPSDGTDGGMDVGVISRNGLAVSLDPASNPNGTLQCFKSGNTYTLDAKGALVSARSRTTDTLIWKTADSKVASVKANAGSFTAALKANAPGMTKIEVVSKLTKQTIARWSIVVTAVGQGSIFSYGDNEPYSFDDGWTNTQEIFPEMLPNLNTREDLEVTLGNEIGTVLNVGEAQWFKFTAPAYGKYQLENTYGYYYIYDNGEWEYQDNGDAYSLRDGKFVEKGYTIYIWIPNQNSTPSYVHIRATGTMYTHLTMNAAEDETGNIAVTGGEHVEFTVPEDNRYTIIEIDEQGKETVKVRGIYRHTGNTVYFTVSDNTVSIRIRKAVKAPTEEFKVTDPIPHWYYFEAVEDNVYQVETIKNGTKDTVFKEDESSKVEDRSAIPLKKGQRIYIGVEAIEGVQGATEEIRVTPNRELVKTPLSDQAMPVTVAVGKPAYVQYTAAEDGIYWLSFKGTGKLTISVSDSMAGEFEEYDPDVYDLFSGVIWEMKAGETVYLEIVDDTDENVNAMAKTVDSAEHKLTNGGIYHLEGGFSGAKMFSYPVAKKGDWKVKLTAENGAAELFVKDNDGITEGTGSVEFTVAVKSEFDLILFMVMSDVETNVTAEITPPTEPTVLTVGENKGLAVSRDGTKFTFAAPENNCYFFTVTDAAKKISAPTGGSIIFTGSDGVYTSGEMPLKADHKETFTISASEDTTVDIGIEKREVKANLTLGGTAVDFTTNDTAGVWLAFYAPQTDMYAFTFTHPESKAFTVDRYTGLTDGEHEDWEAYDEGSAAAKGYYTAVLTKGSTAYIRVKASEASVSGSVTVSASNSLADKDTVSINTADPTKHIVPYHYVVPSDGIYEIKFTSDAGTAKPIMEGEVYDASGYFCGEIHESGTGSVSWIGSRKQGDRLNICVSEDVNGTLTASLQKPTTTALTVGKNEAVTVEAGGEKKFSFAVPASDYYKIVFEEKDGKPFYTDGILHSNGRYVAAEGFIVMAADDVRIWTVTAPSEVSITATVSLPVELSNGTASTEYTVADEEDVQWFHFTALSTGIYRIDLTAAGPEASSEPSVEGEVMEEFLDFLLPFADISSEKKTSGTTVRLKKGKEIWICVNADLAKAKVTAKVTKVAAKPISSDFTASYPISADKADYYEWTLSDTGRYRLTFTAAAENAELSVTTTQGDFSGTGTVSFEMIKPETDSEPITVWSDTGTSVSCSVEKMSKMDVRNVSTVGDFFTWCSREYPVMYIITVPETDLYDIGFKVYLPGVVNSGYFNVYRWEREYGLLNYLGNPWYDQDVGEKDQWIYKGEKVYYYLESGSDDQYIQLGQGNLANSEID